MKRTKYFYVGLILISLILAACSGRPGAGGEEAEAAQADEPTPTVESFVSVEVAEVETGDISQFFNYAGDLQPQKQVNIVPEVGGKIVELNVDIGDSVAKGDLIARLEQESYLIAIEQAEASVASAQAGLDRLEAGSRPGEIAAAQALVQSAKAQLNEILTIDDDERIQASTSLANARAELKRAQEAYDKIAWAGDIGTRQEAVDLEQATIAYETALANYNIGVTPRDSAVAPLMENLARAELSLELVLTPYRDFDFAAAEAAIAQAEAGLKLAKFNMTKTDITAPFAGVISELSVEEGSIVSGQAPISTLISEEVEVLVNAEESRVGLISKGQSAKLNVQAYPGTDFPGVVTSIDPVGDSSSRTFPVTIVPVDEEGVLKSGMYADLSILSEERNDVPLVPQAAIVTLNSQPTVYVVLDDETVEQRDVTTGLENNDQVEILEGVEPGEIVVVAGQPNLADGVKVEVVSGF